MNRRVSFGLANSTSVANPVSRPASVVSSVPALSTQDSLLLERFTAEVFSSAVACTAVLSCFNAVQMNRTIILPADLRRYIPLSPMTFTAVMGSEIIELLHDETRAALSGFQFYIDTGKELLNGHFEVERSELPIEYAALKAMQNQFKSGSSFALLAVKELGLLYCAMRNNEWGDALGRVASDLNEANRGTSPYFNNGQFDVPRLTDPMREVRRQLDSDTASPMPVTRNVDIRDVSPRA